MRKHIPLFALLLSAALLLSSCSWFGRVPDQYELVTTMYFSTVTGQPKVQEQFAANVRLFITDYHSDQAAITVHIDFPEEIGISFDAVPTEFTIDKQDLPYYIAHGDLFYTNWDSTVLHTIAVDPEEDYMILYDGGTGCIVASRDPDANPLLIRQHFQDFLEHYSP